MYILPGRLDADLTAQQPRAHDARPRLTRSAPRMTAGHAAIPSGSQAATFNRELRDPESAIVTCDAEEVPPALDFLRPFYGSGKIRDEAFKTAAHRRLDTRQRRRDGVDGHAFADGLPYYEVRSIYNACAV